MIGNWEDFGGSEPSRYFDFAVAYLRASEDVCSRMMGQEQERTWANASVSMMLAAHSVELFLKGALLSGGVTKWGHTIDNIYSTYQKVFPDEQYQFNCIFLTEYLGFSDEEIRNIKQSRSSTPSVRFRYPVDRPGLEWDGIHGFVPESFLEELSSLNESYARLRGVLANL